MELLIALVLVGALMGSAFLEKLRVGKPRKPLSPVAADVNLTLCAFASLGVVLVALM